MTTKNKALLANITALALEHNYDNEDFIASIATMLETAKGGPKGREHEDQEIDGIRYKWCNRHHQYEAFDLAKFRPNKKTGDFWPTCQLAYEQRQEFTKQINALQKLQKSNLLDEKFDIRANATEIAELEKVRLAKDVAYDTTGTEDYALQEKTETARKKK